VPLLIRTDELKPGTELYEPVVWRGRVMLQAGRSLTGADIRILRRRFPGLGVRVVHPELDGVVEFEDDSRERQVAANTQRQVAECLTEVHDHFSQRASLTRVDLRAVRATVQELMEYLKANPTTAALVSACLDRSSYLGAHAGNVFYLSMVLGATVLDYVVKERKRQIRARGFKSGFASDLAPLGLGAMLIDLGMGPLSHLFGSERPLTRDEREALRQHPSVGFAMLPESLSSVARAIVKTHHENWCGTGYPGQVPGNKLHVFARIVRIADAYDAATSDRVYPQARSPARVLWEMTAGPYRRFYDPRLIQAFASLIQPFPIGCKLRLTDGRYATVVEYNRRDPFDPTVVIAFDSEDRPLPRSRLEEPIRLSTCRGLRIASLHGEDLSFIYSTEAIREITPREEFRSLLEAAYP
jgi:HD-GYP domain-containing protein (c-di-GMP phosphodiesterase class II)